MRVVWLRGFVVVLCLYSAIGSRSSLVLSERDSSSKMKGICNNRVTNSCVNSFSYLCVLAIAIWSQRCVTR